MQGSESVPISRSYAFLIIMLVVVALQRPTSAQEIFPEEDGVFSTREITASAKTEGGNKVIIESATTLGGSLRIKTGEADVVLAKYFKKAKTSSRSKAIDYIDLIGVSLDQSPEGVRLQMRAPNPAPWQERLEAGMITIELTIPDSSFVEIDARLFDIEAEGPFKGMIIPSSLGRIDIVDAHGVIDLSTANQRVSLEDISGEISVTSSNASIEGINLKSRGKPANFRNDGGDILLDDFIGEINVRNNFGRISIVGFTPQGTKNFIRGLSEPILLEIVDMDNARLIVSNQYEDIELVVPREISAVISMAVDEGGVIEASNLIVKPDLIEDNRLYLVSGAGVSTLSGSIQGRGNIYIQGRE